jgi:exodeoxyribonuclease V
MIIPATRQTFYDALSDDQSEALDEIERTIWGNRQTCVVHGLAGTGKTHLLAEVARRYPGALAIAPTGKAAHVLRQRIRRNASTIHGLFYRLVEQIVDERTGRTRLVFQKVHEVGALSGKIVLVDEVSMVPAPIARDLMDSGAKTIAFGDPGQLPPVQGTTYFDEPDAVLRHIHRQAAGSRIIRQAHAVRAGGFYRDDGPEFRVEREAEDEDIYDADVILCHLRDTRHRINEHKRRLLGFRGQYPVRGEPILCHANNTELGVWNGGVYPTIAYNPHRNTIVIDVDGDEIEVTNCRFGEFDDPINGHPTFSFAYALTVHKAQGSEWENVLVVDEYQTYPETRRRWLYTAITRASQHVLMVKQI